MKLIFICALVLSSFFAKAQNRVDTLITDSLKRDTSEKFIPVETQPEFPGGMINLYQYFQKNKSKKIKEKGRVLVSFVVEKDGNLTDIKIVSSLSAEADAEAIRLVSKSPKWKPGMAQGKPCRVLYSLPVIFQ